MALGVGTTSNSTLRRSASRFTSFITGSLPYAPVPTTSRRHFQGMSSSMDRGVCPNSSRNQWLASCLFGTGVLRGHRALSCACHTRLLGSAASRYQNRAAWAYRRRFFLALADLAAVNHHVVVAGDAIDPDRTEGKLVEAHRCTSPHVQALFLEVITEKADQRC